MRPALTETRTAVAAQTAAFTVALAEDDAATKPRMTDSNAPRLKAFSGLADKETTAPLDVEYVTESKE